MKARTIFHTFILLLSSLVFVCNYMYAQEQKKELPKWPYKVINVSFISKKFDLESTISKLPENLTPADPDKTKCTIFSVTLKSDLDELISVASFNFLVTYANFGKIDTAQCVGMNVWDDTWCIGDCNGQYFNMKNGCKTKLIFLIPKNIKKINFLQRMKPDKYKVIKQLVPIL